MAFKQWLAWQTIGRFESLWLGSSPGYQGKGSTFAFSDNTFDACCAGGPTFRADLLLHMMFDKLSVPVVVKCQYLFL